MLLKTAKRSGTVAWSPLNDHRGLLACGTVANAIDDSFETTADLEIFSVDFAAGSPNDMSAKGGAVKSTERFHQLAWGGVAQAPSSLPLGILAGGMVDGSIGLWNPAAITKEVEGEALLSRAQKHKGPVRGLDFNQFKPNLLASGATESEILIWDLTTPTTPNVYTPGQSTGAVTDITCVAWNPKVEHILASTGSSGSSVVWDLRQKRSVISFTDSATKTSRSCLAWNPDIATQVIVASDDDSTPILQMWDLRNAHAPAKTLQGHTRGILSMSWCPFDSSMLLTAGKDSRTLCWNPNDSSIMCELPASGNWNFDVRWSPKLPAILSTSSFDGSVNVYSLTDTGNGTSGGAAAAPGWLKRPAGAAFGFGGQLVTFAKPPPETAGARPTVKVHKIVTEPEFLTQADELDAAVTSGTLNAFCESKIAACGADKDTAEEWKFMHILFEEDARRKLMNHVGFSADAITEEVLSLKLADLKLDQFPKKPAFKASSEAPASSKAASPPPADKPAEEQEEEEEKLADAAASEPTADSLFGDSGAADDFLAPQPPPPEPVAAPAAEAVPADAAAAAAAAAAAPSPLSQPLVSEAVGPNPVLDAAVKRAIIAGNFEAAVDVCVKFGRMADALLLAATGGRELFQRTQERYFELMKDQPFMKITHSIVNRELEGIVDSSDASSWKETLAILCTYANMEEFSALCDKLALRLQSAGGEHERSATLCYICAGNVEATVRIWMEQQSRAGGGAVSKLESLVEKICVLLALDVTKQGTLPAVVGEKYSEFAEVLVAQGRMFQGNQYLMRANAAQTLSAAVLRDRIFHSDLRNMQQIPPDQYPQFPYERNEPWIAPARPAKPAPVAPSSGGQPVAQAQYNAVADAFGSAFGEAPQAAQAPAFAQPQQQQQPQQPAFAQPQQPAFAQPQQPAYAQPQQPQQPAYAAQPAYQAQPAPAAQPAPVAQQPQGQATGYPTQQYGAYTAQPAAQPAPAAPAPSAQQPVQQQQPPAAQAPAAAPVAPPAQPQPLTQEQKYIQTTVGNLKTRLCANMQKKMAEDVAKKLLTLDEKLAANQVSAEVCTQFAQWCQAMERNDVATAGSIQTALTSSVWDEHGSWLQATKRLVDQAKKG